MPKFQIGQLVEFGADRFQDEEHQYEDYNLKYRKGSKGYVMDIYGSPKSLEELAAGINAANTLYKIQVGMGEIIDVPETDLFDPNADLRAKVEERLRAGQEKKEFKDTERIGGSKKEKAAYKHILTSDLAELEKDEATAIELVKKDKVYPKVDIPGEQEKGTSAGAAFLKVKMRESMASQPPNSPEKRKVYVGFIEYLVKKFSDVISVKEFKDKTDEVLTDGLNEIVNILNPEEYKKSLRIKEETDAKKKILSEKSENLKEDINRLRKVIREKYPNLWNEDKTVFQWFDVPGDDSDKIEYYELDAQIDALNKEVRETEKEVGDIQSQFLKQLGLPATYYSLHSATKQVLEEIFGVRFVNFLSKYATEAVQSTYKEAEKYEPLPVEESARLTEQNTSYIIKNLADYRSQLEKLNTLRIKEQFDEFFDKERHGYIGFWKFARNKHLFYKDVKTVEEIQWYRDMYKEHIEREIAKGEKQYAATIEEYKPRENNWEWATGKASGTRQKKSELTINQGLPLSFIKRTGGYVITDADITVASIQAKFGFKDVEFGQSIKDNEAREHVRHFLAAMADFGDILNLNLIALNKIGDLKITFGSRGSGKASAHYESLRKLINLTKSRGDGSVAHEYFHYLDNILPKIDNDDYTYDKWASVTRQTVARKKYFYNVDSVKNSAVRNAIKDIFNYIYDKSGETFIKDTIYANDKKYNLPAYIIADNIDDYIKQFFDIYGHYRSFDRLTPKDRDVLGSIVHKFGYDKYDMEFKINSSLFYASSKKMSSEYWTRPWELFARAGETYIYDKLQKAERANNYLVSGDYFDHPSGVYPMGVEREDLFGLYDKFFETMKREYALDGFVKFTDQRSDEYIDLADKTSEEKVETGIIVDSQTKEVIEKIGESNETKIRLLKDKMQKLGILLTMHKQSKLKKGGEITAVDLLITSCSCNKQN